MKGGTAIEAITLPLARISYVAIPLTAGQVIPSESALRSASLLIAGRPGADGRVNSESKGSDQGESPLEFLARRRTTCIVFGVRPPKVCPLDASDRISDAPNRTSNSEASAT